MIVASSRDLFHFGEGDLGTVDSWKTVLFPANELGVELYSMSANNVGQILIVGKTIRPTGNDETEVKGIALFNKDRGMTWADITPQTSLTAMTKVKLFNDGTAFIAGGKGKAWTVSGL